MRFCHSKSLPAEGGGFCEAKDGGSSIKPLRLFLPSAPTYFINLGTSPKSPCNPTIIDKPDKIIDFYY